MHGGCALPECLECRCKYEYRLELIRVVQIVWGRQFARSANQAIERSVVAHCIKAQNPEPASVPTKDRRWAKIPELLYGQVPFVPRRDTFTACDNLECELKARHRSFIWRWPGRSIFCRISSKVMLSGVF